MRWEQITNHQEAKDYYRERIGDLVPEPPSVTADPDSLAVHLSELGILTRLAQDNPTAWSQLLFVDARPLDGRWHILLPIDDPHPGSDAVLYLHRNAKTPEDHALMSALAQLSNRCHQLYEWWTADH